MGVGLSDMLCRKLSLGITGLPWQANWLLLGSLVMFLQTVLDRRTKYLVILQDFGTHPLPPFYGILALWTDSIVFLCIYK